MTTASTILGKQNAIAALRKAVTQAKTRTHEAKRDIKTYSSYLEQDPSATHLVELIAQSESKLVAAKVDLAKAQAELAQAELVLPVVAESKFSAILKWFSGTSLVKAKDALELLDASLEHGSWVPGASRKVRAAVGKPNVAKKELKVNCDARDSRAGSAIDYAISYGSFGGLAQLSLKDATRGLSDRALEFYIDFRPLVDTLDRLDATRPVPTFTKLNASPTISAELERQGAEAVEVAEIVYEEIEGIDKQGRKFFKLVARIVWPEGIKHSTSRYAYGTNDNSQCHACGHAIKNPFNWVPLVLTTRAGGKKSLWVGRDCAETLFGVKLTGELELAEGQR